MLTNLFFNTPWWLPTLLIGAGVVLFWNGNRRQEGRLRNVGLGLIAVAVALCAVSYLVDTDLEKCVKRSKALVYDVEKQDWAGMQAILDPHCTVSVLNSEQIYTSRDAIIGGAKAAVDRFGVKNVRVFSAAAEQTDTLITVTMGVLSDHENAGVGTINTSWQLEWQQSGDHWSLVRITNLKIGNATGDAASAQFPKPR
jgi:hypothetical protein